MNADTGAAARCTRRFAAPAERVFDAWLDPDLLGRWMFGPQVRDEEVLKIQVDPRVGGLFAFQVRRQGTILEHVGRYLEIRRPDHLAFTWGVADHGTGARVDVLIAAADGGCEVSLRHELQPEWAAYGDRIAASWDRMLQALERALGG